ncbi:hypothetical protein ILUMI_02402 [Ignelater luminosus]|uniref:Uncharacterized protein n=1 Tax=Ignelater luminosus TaxID=2038154 RepID=A0A8K0DNU4_IGNLU|nr:hypothetical protein ILUMI_02402 [Ignelater luminosus]
MEKIYCTCVWTVFTVSLIIAQKDLQFPGRCPSIDQVKASFNESKFAGRWYEISRFPNRHIIGECVIIDFLKHSARKKDFEVHFLFTNISCNWNTSVKFELVKTPDPTLPSYDVYVNDKKEDIQMYILDTDYKSYSVIWGCFYNPRKQENTQRLSIISRNKVVNKGFCTKTFEILNTNGIDRQYLKIVQQNDATCGRNSGSKAAKVKLVVLMAVAMFCRKLSLNTIPQPKTTNCV